MTNCLIKKKISRMLIIKRLNGKEEENQPSSFHTQGTKSVLVVDPGYMFFVRISPPLLKIIFSV